MRTGRPTYGLQIRRIKEVWQKTPLEQTELGLLRFKNL